VLSFSFFCCSVYKVYKSIFTSPSSAADYCESEHENEAPLKAAKLSQSRKKATKRNVASKLHMNDKVTPRSIAYAAVQVFDAFCWNTCSCLSLLQLHFNLQTAERWYEIYGGFDYRGLYNYIVDFFEDVQERPAKKRAQDLLNWWSL
jgi:hypothetical protein